MKLHTKPERATVTWNDAHSDRAEFGDEEMNRWHRPMVQERTGWILRSDKAGVTMCFEMEVLHDGWTNRARYRSHYFIPRANIVKVEYLKPKAK